jgi:hypothetical protein
MQYNIPDNRPIANPILFAINDAMQNLSPAMKAMVSFTEIQKKGLIGKTPEITINPKAVKNSELKGIIELLKSFDPKMFDLKGVKLKELAQGGVVKPTSLGTLAKIAEGGKPEAVVPLDQLSTMLSGKTDLTSTLKDIVSQSKEQSPLDNLNNNLFKQLSDFTQFTMSQMPKIEIDPTKLNMGSTLTSQPQIVNESNTTNNNAPATYNYYNTVNIPVKNGDPQTIISVVRQVLYERETTV